MPNDSHAKARLLLDQSVIEGISVDDQRWLAAHTRDCAECGRYAENSRRTIRALDCFAFEMDPVAALRVENAVREHAKRLASAESQRGRFLTAAAAAVFLAVAGSAAMWQPAAWLAARWNLPTPAWQAGFAIFWFLPSALAGMLPFFRHLLGGDSTQGEQTL